MTAAIKVKGLGKHYAAKAILSNIDFEVMSGQVVALLGSSGSGKSTLLRCLNLLTQPDRGQMCINGMQFSFVEGGLNRVTERDIINLRTQVGMVFQQFNLWAHKTILANLIEAPMRVLKVKREQARQQAEQMLAKVGLSEHSQAYPAQLSGGQQQRAAIARALMMQPKLLLFDEPTSALDPERVGEVLLVMQQLASEGITMMVATHEMGFAKNVADQVMFLHNGVIHERGSAEQMFAQPKTERFQQFLAAVQQI